jgi:hypothetical protein
MDSEGFIYLSDGNFVGRYRGSIDRLSGSTYIDVLCTATKDRLRLAVMHWHEITKADAELKMLENLHKKKMNERIAVGRIEKLQALEREFGLKAHGFDRREDALLACVVLQYVTSIEPELILPIDPDDVSYSVEESRINGQWIVMSEMYLDIADVILMRHLEPPPQKPWWWNEIDIDDMKVQYLVPMPTDYLELVNYGRLCGIIRPSGGDVERGLPESLTNLYWEDVISDYWFPCKEEDEPFN